MSYTKGKWFYAPEYSAVRVVYSHALKAVADFGKIDLPEKEANAKLISAAPDLLEALKAIVQWQQDEGELAGKGPYDVAQYAKQAIAKATGEAV